MDDLESIIEECGMTRIDLEIVCTKRYRNKIALFVGDWRSVAAMLNFSRDEIDTIDGENHTAQQKKLALFDRWGEKYGKQATFFKLAEAFHDLGRRDVIEKVCKQTKLRRKQSAKKDIPTNGLKSERMCKPTFLIAIITVIVTLVLVFIWFYSSGHFHSIVVYNLNWQFSKGLPPCPLTFVGRANEKQEIVLQLMDKTNKIIHVIGPPGFGKSTLTICVGNILISRRYFGGYVVRYIDLSDVAHHPVEQAMAEKILYQESTGSRLFNVTFNQLLSWAARRFWSNIVIFDNCDEVLNHQKDQFNDAVERFVQQSDYIKVLITSREESLYLEQSRGVKVESLTVNESCELLEIKSPDLLSTKEKEAIANLTGNVPLALQIIGSLLNRKLKPPQPSVIIKELKYQPIPTLSPADLRRNMRINVSISVSYNYLDSKLKKIARYFANFPGSFTKSTATAVLRLIFPNTVKVTDNYIRESLDSLVSRSLLEYNIHTRRYHFHYLLREFFLGVQLEMHKTERSKFIIAFYIQMSTILNELTIRFEKSTKEALLALDDERPSVRYLLNITRYPHFINSSNDTYLNAVDAINAAIDSNFLPCRLSAEELTESTYSIAKIMEASVNQMYVERKSKLDTFNHYRRYVDFVVHHADLLWRINLPQEATKWLLSQIMTFEHMSKRIFDPKFEKIMATTYNKFYIKLLMFEHLLDAEHVRMCNTRVLQKTIILHYNTKETSDLLETCKNNENTCPYKIIGSTYYHIKEYKRSILFLEQAFRDNEVFELADHVTLSVYLVESYQYSGDEERAMDAFKRTVIPVYTDVLQSSSTFTISSYNHYVRTLRHYGETEKALELERKKLNELLETSAKGGITEAYIARDFAYEMYKQANNTEAISMAKLALRLMVTTSERETDLNILKLQMKILIGKAHYQNGNMKDSFESFKEVVDWIIQHEAIKLYGKMYYESCFYFMGMLRMDYVYECFLNDLGYTSIWDGLIDLGYLIVAPPLDLYVKEEEKKPSRDFKEILHESKIKDILPPVQDNDSALATRYHFLNLESIVDVNYLLNEIGGYIDSAIKFALSFTIIRGLVNIIVVLLKILLLLLLNLCCCMCGCCCSCCTLCAVNKLIFKHLLVRVFRYVEIKFFGHVY